MTSTAPAPSNLGPREREILDVVYRLGRAAVAEVRAELPKPPSYSAVRALLGKLERKGHLTHENEGGRYVYQPTVPPNVARASALERVVRTFFRDSPADAVAALIDLRGEDISDEEIEELTRRIREARNNEP